MSTQQSAVYFRRPGLYFLIFIGLLAVGCSLVWLRSAPVKACGTPRTSQGQAQHRRQCYGYSSRVHD